MVAIHCVVHDDQVNKADLMQLVTEVGEPRLSIE